MKARRFLDHAGVFTTYVWSDEPDGPPFLHLMYPITPVELRAGMVLGEERILTNRSGRYGWPDNSAAAIHVIDADGLAERGDTRHQLVQVGDDDHQAGVVRYVLQRAIDGRLRRSERQCQAQAHQNQQ